MKKRIITAVWVTGAGGIIAQLVLLRELLIIFSGNEFSIGIILANWLIIEALGSYSVRNVSFSKKKTVVLYCIFTFLFSFSLPFMIFFTRDIRNILSLSVAQSIGIFPVIFSSLLILLTVSFSHGALFTLGCRLYSLFSKEDVRSGSGRVYAHEILGTITGGLLWSFVLIPGFNSFTICAGILALNCLICLLLTSHYFSKGGFIFKILTIFFISILVFSAAAPMMNLTEKIHIYSVKRQWSPLKPLHYSNSKYGNIFVTESEGHYTFFLDGTPRIFAPYPDLVYIERFVHIPAFSHPFPEIMLMIGNGAGGKISEALKHSSVQKIEYAELDPVLIDVIKKFPTGLTEYELFDDRVKVINTDGLLHLRLGRQYYDIIYLGINEISDLQSNRFFTEEFFYLCKRSLRDGGIVVFSLPGSFGYLSKELVDLNSSIYHTLKEVFPNIRIFPGDGSNLFLASESEDILNMNEDILAERVFERMPEADVFVPRHIRNDLHPGWAGWFYELTENGSKRINRDLDPAGVFYSLSHWNAVYNPSFRKLFRMADSLKVMHLTGAAALFFAVVIFIRRKRGSASRRYLPAAIASSGFSGMIFDLSLIFVFQALYGHVFAWIGILVTFFMAGSASGAFTVTHFLPRINNKRRLFFILEGLIIFFAFLIPAVFTAVSPFAADADMLNMIKALILIMTFTGGMLISAQFPLAISLYREEGQDSKGHAGLFYAGDLAGGWLGGMTGGVILLPVLGLTGACVAAALVKICALGFAPDLKK